MWRRLREREPDALLAAVGFSLGGNVLLKALGEEGARASVDFAAAVSVPFRLDECAQALNRGFGRFYQAAMFKYLRQKLASKEANGSLSPKIDLQAVLAARDFLGFDDIFTAPLHGFADGRDYYERCGCGQFLRAIRRPTLIIHARDDPFMAPEIVPGAAGLAPSVRLELANHGGHMGFIEAGPLGRPRAWLPGRLSSWVQEQASDAVAS